jgi:hypothetical protein
MRSVFTLALSLLLTQGSFGGACAQNQAGSAALPRDSEYRFLESSDQTFTLPRAGALFAGKAAPLALSVINYFGTANQITDGLKAQEPIVKGMLDKSHMPGVLIYVEHQTSNSDVQITTLVGGKPIVMGPGLNQLSTLQAYRATNKDTLDPQVSAGYSLNEEASYFLWAKKVADHIEYGMTVPARLINEERRTLSDAELTKQFLERYDNDLRSNILKELEDRASNASLRQQAKNLLDQRQKALEERRRIDQDLKEALERAAKAQQTAVVFETLVRALTVAQLGASLAAEFPDKSADINAAKTTSDLKKILDDLVTESNDKKVLVNGRLEQYENRQQNIRLEELRVFRVEKINPDDVPGMLP